MSKYNELTIEEKNSLLNIFKLYVDNTSIHDKLFLDKKTYNILLFEKRGIELIGTHLISNGGKWTEGGGAVKYRPETLELNTDSDFGLTSYYKDYNIPGFDNKLVIDFKTSKIDFFQTYDMDLKEWRGNRVRSCFSLSCWFHIIAMRLYEFNLTVYKLDKEESSFFGGKRKFIKPYRLVPFSDIKDNDGFYQSNDIDFWKFIENKEYEEYLLDDKDIEFLKELYNLLNNFIIDMYSEVIEFPLRDKQKEKEVVQSKIKKVIVEEFDKNNNGELDILEGDNVVIDLLKENEKTIVDFDHTLIQDIVKLNEFLNTKKENLSKIFELLSSVETEYEMSSIVNTLKLSIENYQSLLIHSINMIISIKEKKLTEYYEIRACFDKLNVFNSNWENEISEQLGQINIKLSSVLSSLTDITRSIKSLEITTKKSLDKLTSSTKLSFKSLEKEIGTIRRGVGLNNLLTAINAYQTYKLREK
jgi:hypothetical protein